MKLLVLTLSLLAFAFSSVGASHAASVKDNKDTQELEQVVVTATMTERTVADAPGSVEIITSREIREMNASTVAQALEAAVGLEIKTESGRVSAPSIRGTKSKHTLILIDGRRLAAGFRDIVDIHQIPVTLVDRIEIVRGPASSLYGSDALGGVVNIITKKPAKKWQAGAKAQYGVNKSGDGKEYLASGYGGGHYERFSFIGGAEYLKKEGWDRVVNENDDGDKTRMGFGAGRFALELLHHQTFSGGFEYGDMNRDGLRYMEAINRDRDSTDTRSGYFLQYDAKINGLYPIMFRINRSEARSKILITPPTSASSGEAGTTEYFLNQAEGRASGLFFDRHLVTAGFELRKEGRDDDTSNMNTNNLSAFLQDEYQIFDPLCLVIGLRFDHHSEFGSQWTPKASLIYNFNKYLRAKGSYGRGFRAPTITELSITSWKQKGKLIYEPNPNLDAESSDSYELRLEGEYKILRGSVTFFRNDVRNMIDAVYYKTEGTGANKKDYYKYRNIAHAVMQGVELESGVKIPFGFSLTGNLTWLDTEDKDTEKDLEGQPDYKGSLKLAYDYAPWKLHANVRGSYYGRTYYASGDEGGYGLLHVYVSKGLVNHVKLYAGVDNILDRTEKEPTFYYSGVSLDF